MDRNQRIEDICKESLGMIGDALSSAIAHAITEGYKLGWEECARQFDLDVNPPSMN